MIIAYRVKLVGQSDKTTHLIAVEIFWVLVVDLLLYWLRLQFGNHHFPVRRNEKYLSNPRKDISNKPSKASEVPHTLEYI